MIWRIAFILAAVSVFGGGLAAPLVFQNPLAQTQWRITKGEFTCRMTQAIQDYGTVEFEQFGVGTLRLRIHALPGLYQGQLVRLTSVPSPWQKGGEAQVLALRAGRAGWPVALNDGPARQALLALAAGRSLVWDYPADGKPQIRGMLGPLGFRSALAKLQACATTLPRVALSDFARTRVYFASGSAQLSASAQRRLRRLVAFVQAYGHVKKIIITGYTDDVGSVRSNLELGARRAQAVADFLRRQGVGLPMEVRSLGQAHPLASNQTASGRARNRRVTVNLIALQRLP